MSIRINGACAVIARLVGIISETQESRFFDDMSKQISGKTVVQGLENTYV